MHNTVADAILQLEYNPNLNITNNFTHAMLGVILEELSAQWWKSFVHHWQSYNESSASTQAHCFHMNEVFADCNKEDEIYPLTADKISEAQQAESTLKQFNKRVLGRMANLK
jgi:hypothetical protein